MKTPAVLCMVGSSAIVDAVERRAVAQGMPFDAALEAMSSAEVTRLAVEAMPSKVREVFLAQRRRTGAPVTATLGMLTERPLTDDERSVCRKLGMSEAAYLEERNRGLAPVNSGGLTEGELNAARVLGMSADAYRAAKAGA